MAKKLTLEWLTTIRAVDEKVPEVGLFGLFTLPSNINVTNVRRWVKRLDEDSLWWLIRKMIPNAQTAAAILAHLHLPMDCADSAARNATSALCKLSKKRLVRAIVQLAERSPHFPEES